MPHSSSILFTNWGKTILALLALDSQHFAVSGLKSINISCLGLKKKIAIIKKKERDREIPKNEDLSGKKKKKNFLLEHRIQWWNIIQ